MKRFSLLIVVLACICFSSWQEIATASERETELFNKGYEYLFSYKPDKASETFRMFLKEFPESSARDAALFWLGKTLVSMKSYDEAELTFQTIRKEFPDSPFIVFINVEMGEIVKLRSAGINKESKETPATQKDSALKEGKDDKKSAEAEKKLSQLLSDKEKTEALLGQERKASQEQMLRITDLETRDSLLKKQIAELEDQVRRLGDVERSLKESRDERDRLRAQIAKFSAEKSPSEKDAGITAEQQTVEQKPVIEAGEPLRFRLAQLELLSEEQGKELTKSREEQEKLKKLIQDEKKFTSELRADLARSKDSKDKETGDKPISPGKETEKLTGEVNLFKGQVSGLQVENKNLTDRIEELEFQAEQRIRDMKILNAYLSKLMFQKKEAPKPQIDPKVAAERDDLKTALEEEKKRSAELRGQLANLKEQRKDPALMQKEMLPATQPPSGNLIQIENKAFTLSQVIDRQTSAALLFRRLGAKEPVWRLGDPLNDFIAEELLLQEAVKTGITIDPKKQQEMVERHKLSAAEASYLEKLLTIARYIDTLYTDGPAEKKIELITVDYKPGDAASKTVLATDLQKAARSGASFEEIGKMHPAGVKFSRLSIQEFSAKYKDKSQIIQKLNFLNEETVVMWSDKGYMLIKPVSGRIPFNPFEDFTSEKKEKLKAFLKQWFAEHRK